MSDHQRETNRKSVGKAIIVRVETPPRREMRVSVEVAKSTPKEIVVSVITVIAVTTEIPLKIIGMEK